MSDRLKPLLGHHIRVEDREVSIDMNKAYLAKAPHFDPTRQLEGYLKALA